MRLRPSDINPTDIGFLRNGQFQPFTQEAIRRNNPEPGMFVSGFLNVTGAQAIEVFRSGKCEWMHPDAVWDVELGSLVHVGWWYRRHPNELMRLSERDIDRLSLREYRDSLVAQG